MKSTSMDIVHSPESLEKISNFQKDRGVKFTAPIWEELRKNSRILKTAKAF